MVVMVRGRLEPLAIGIHLSGEGRPRGAKRILRQWLEKPSDDKRNLLFSPTVR